MEWKNAELENKGREKVEGKWEMGGRKLEKGGRKLEKGERRKRGREEGNGRSGRKAGISW
jgi:hypothetical protein